MRTEALPGGGSRPGDEAGNAGLQPAPTLRAPAAWSPCSPARKHNLGGALGAAAAVEVDAAVQDLSHKLEQLLRRRAAEAPEEPPAGSRSEEAQRRAAAAGRARRAAGRTRGARRGGAPAAPGRRGGRAARQDGRRGWTASDTLGRRQPAIGRWAAASGTPRSIPGAPRPDPGAARGPRPGRRPPAAEAAAGRAPQRRCCGREGAQASRHARAVQAGRAAVGTRAAAAGLLKTRGVQQICFLQPFNLPTSLPRDTLDRRTFRRAAGPQPPRQRWAPRSPAGPAPQPAGRNG